MLLLWCALPKGALTLNTYEHTHIHTHTQAHTHTLTHTHTHAHTHTRTHTYHIHAHADPREAQRADFAEYFSGNKQLPGTQPAAHCYCGHQ